MAITLVGTGGLFPRLGKIGLTLNSVNNLRGTAGSPNLATLVNNIEAQFASTNQQLVDGLYSARDSYRSVHGSFATYLQTLAKNVLIQMADDDVKLVSKDLTTALKELDKQMRASSDAIEQPTVSVTAAAGSSNTGTGKLVGSVKNPYGVTRDYVFDETIDFLATSDSQLGATAGREPFSVRGDAQESDPLSWYWPRGSGCTSSLNAIDAAEDAGSNKLRNSDFTDFTSNTPTYWTVLVGTAGTDILSASAANSLGSSGSALQFTGTGGAPLSSLAQTFNSSSGTTATLKPNTVYHYSFWAKKSASLAAGALQIGLLDGSDAAVSDDASTANTTTIAHGTLSTSYAHFSGAFITPKSLPSTQKLRVRISTALTSGESVYVDHLSFAEATLLYAGGPYATLHSGATAFILNDSFTLTVANNFASDWAKMLERLFGLRALGIQLPSATGGSITIADSLLA